jgi:transcriptional regulator with XRE-family HTH domain
MILNVAYLAELLEKNGWSKRQLARNSGLSIATISRIISGKRGAGSRTLTGIRKAFPNEPIEKLFFLS